MLFGTCCVAVIGTRTNSRVHKDNFIWYCISVPDTNDRDYSKLGSPDCRKRPFMA